MKNGDLLNIAWLKWVVQNSQKGYWEQRETFEERQKGTAVETWC